MLEVKAPAGYVEMFAQYLDDNDADFMVDEDFAFLYDAEWKLVGIRIMRRHSEILSTLSEMYSEIEQLYS
jgi:hypothetical protein